MKKTIGVVGCTTTTAHGRDQFERLAVEAARRGVELVGLDLSSSLDSSADRVVAGRYVILSSLDEDGLAAATREATEIDAFLTTREAFVPAVAGLAAITETPGNSVAAIETMRHKDQCRRVFAAAGLPQPSSFLVQDESPFGLSDRLRGLGDPPWIVKPQIGTGSEGVVQADTAVEVAEAIEATCVPTLVEAFVHGREMSVEGVFVNGRPEILSVTDKAIAGSFVECAHRAPAVLTPQERSSIDSTVVTGLTALGLTRGIVHVELWVTSDGSVVLGEAHARPGGDFIHALVEETRPGLELYGMLIDDLLDRPSIPVPPQTRYAGVRYLLLPEGVVSRVRASAPSDSRIVRTALDIKAGSVVRPVHASSDRSGVFVAVADDPAEVEAALDAALAGVVVDWVDA